MKKYKIAFVCVHNSCRSQMAEGLMNKFGSDIFEVYSAGTENYPEVKPLAVEVMEDIGVDMSGYRPKLLTDIPSELDFLITMGCNVSCPHVPNKYRDDFGITDPSGGPKEDYEEARELIKGKILDLIEKVKDGTIVI